MNESGLQAIAQLAVAVAAICAAILAGLGYRKVNGWVPTHKPKPRRRRRERRPKKETAAPDDTDAAVPGDKPSG